MHRLSQRLQRDLDKICKYFRWKLNTIPCMVEKMFEALKYSKMTDFFHFWHKTLDVLNSKITEFHCFSDSSPWLKKILDFDVLNYSKMSEFYWNDGARWMEFCELVGIYIQAQISSSKEIFEEPTSELYQPIFCHTSLMFWILYCH